MTSSFFDMQIWPFIVLSLSYPLRILWRNKMNSILNTKLKNKRYLSFSQYIYFQNFSCCPNLEETSKIFFKNEVLSSQTTKIWRKCKDWHDMVKINYVFNCINFTRYNLSHSFMCSVLPFMTPHIWCYFSLVFRHKNRIREVAGDSHIYPESLQVLNWCISIPLQITFHEKFAMVSVTVYNQRPHLELHMLTGGALGSWFNRGDTITIKGYSPDESTANRSFGR